MGVAEPRIATITAVLIGFYGFGRPQRVTVLAVTPL
jgi:hypothetical protein